MKAIDFYADYAKWEGTVWYKSKETLRMPTSWDKMLYCRLRSGSRRGECIYEYYLLKKKKETEMYRFFLALVGALDGFTAEEQYRILKRMECIELEFNMTEEELRSDSRNPNPLFSIRGTCGQENICKRNCACRTVYFEPCCHDRKVGHSWVASIMNPKFYAFLTDLVIWKALCPELDMLFVSQDCSDYGKQNYRFSFVIKNDRITFVKGRKRVKRLYYIYN